MNKRENINEGLNEIFPSMEELQFDCDAENSAIESRAILFYHQQEHCRIRCRFLECFKEGWRYIRDGRIVSEYRG